MHADRLISSRARGIDASGIRRVFELGAKMADPINLSIGQPDFPVPQRLIDSASNALREGGNGYSVTQGIAPLRARIAAELSKDAGWTCDLASGPGRTGTGLLVTSGTSGALLLLSLALLDDGDEAIIPDPYFVMYPHLAKMAGARAVLCDTYPDFQLTAERVEPLITERTKFVLLNTPGNPHGVTVTQQQCEDLLDLCRRKNVLLVSDEIYDEFTYPESAVLAGGKNRCPSPARFKDAEQDVLLIRGFGKTYGCTGWRLGYAAGPRRIIEEMAKLQQYTFVCAPTPLQWGVIGALDTDMSPQIADYRTRRDLVMERLGGVTEVALPGGAFYAFPKVPERLGVDATRFVDRCIAEQLLVIPGSVFSSRDTHFRLSYATRRDQLERGLDVLVKLMKK